MFTLRQVAKQLGVHPSLLRYGSRTPGAIPDVILMKVDGRSVSTSSKPPASSQSSRPVVASAPQQIAVKSIERSASQAAQPVTRPSYFPDNYLPLPVAPTKPKKKETIFGSEEYPYEQINKRQIPKIFEERLPGVDSLPYLAAAEVFPTRLNNYVIDNHIHW